MVVNEGRTKSGDKACGSVSQPSPRHLPFSRSLGASCPPEPPSSSLSDASSSMFGTARNALHLSRLRIYSALLPIAAAQRPRNVSTVSFDPTIRQFLVKLAEHQPCFSMHSSSVSIMHEPRLFYQTLLVRDKCCADDMLDTEASV